MRPVVSNGNSRVVTGGGRSLSQWLKLALVAVVATLGIVPLGAQPLKLVINLDRTTRDWSDLAMGGPSAEDDANQGRNPHAVFSYVTSFGKPHADAGAHGVNLPRLNDGKFAMNGDDPPNSTWFDTKGNSRILVDLGRRMDVARINVYSWHSGALSPLAKQARVESQWVPLGDRCLRGRPEPRRCYGDPPGGGNTDTRVRKHPPLQTAEG